MAIHANFLLRGPQGTSSQATHRGLTALCCLAEEHAAKQRLAAARSEAEEELARLNALRQEAAQSHANNAAAHQEADTLTDSWPPCARRLRRHSAAVMLQRQLKHQSPR